ncbi:piggyBac transposable element-derived protein 4 [Nematostella vectensis]|uniref:piggyBac transposable element-derived protein 4-like n=1 Tax=Nematostella vectensis TaxID=45351 RepID=UPI0020777E41|nr:piggyBac transposable element-derived protein 4-like [Nematostella vectensis]XP_048588535.1 piggyBac transposable element-derived protein 4 [Nematostella vectensis]
MASVRVRRNRQRNLTVDEVLSSVFDENTTDLDSSDSEDGEDELPTLFPAIPADLEDDSVESVSSYEDSSSSSSDSEFDRRQSVTNQRQEKARNLRECSQNARRTIRGVRRGRGARRGRAISVQQRREIQDGGRQQYIWSKEVNRRILKPFTNAVGLANRGQRREKSALEYFELFFDQEVWDCLVTMTNLNAERKGAKGTSGGQWKPITQDEMKAFFGLNIAMGIVKLPEAKMYWQKKIWLLTVPSFSQVMSRNRFFQILQYIHVSDDSNIVPSGQPGYDKLHKIKPLLNLLFPKFENAYNLHKNISIDECMIPWRGRLSFRQFIANKPVRFGIKVWVLADSESKYVYRQQLYIGKNPGERAEVGLAARVVKELCSGLEGMGHHLYTDNYYTSVELYQFLFDNQIYACGTIKGNRKNFAKEVLFENTRGLARGSSKWLMCGPLLAVGWLDNKAVYFLSTIHPPEFPVRAPVHARNVKRRGAGEGGQSGDIPCPPLLKDYNAYMGGVDQSDQMLRYYTCIRKTVKWYRRVLFHEVEVAIHNAFVLECEDREGTPRPIRTSLEFREELAENLIGNMRVAHNAAQRPPRNEELRLTDVGLHLPEMRQDKGNCAVCSKKIRKTHSDRYKDVPLARRPKVPYVPRPSIYCNVCNVFLCLQKDQNCWKDFHTKVEYWR